ncbi:MAG: hypothetical protein SVQ76_02115, partial [Candidatus Nanohaloarchaea archaeon]|nr:hypothetical protein [Candidatus Nanohaloarchaea archaeon]
MGDGKPQKEMNTRELKESLMNKTEEILGREVNGSAEVVAFQAFLTGVQLEDEENALEAYEEEIG